MALIQSALLLILLLGVVIVVTYWLELIDPNEVFPSLLGVHESLQVLFRYQHFVTKNNFLATVVRIHGLLKIYFILTSKFRVNTFK